ncbi:TPA: hypothetical protein PB396_002697 [Staphylococcus aureus]|nr:hypothetical protein [Staphylococcus aureus]
MINDLIMSDESKCIIETIEETLFFEGETVKSVASQNMFLNQASNKSIEEVIKSLNKNNVYSRSLKEFVEKGNLKEVSYDIVKINIVKAIKLDALDSCY